MDAMSHRAGAHAQDQPSVLVTSTVVDRLSTNSVIRNYILEGFRACLAPSRASACSLELAFKQVEATRPSLVVAAGSLASDATDLRRLRRATEAAGSLLAIWVHEDPYEFDYAFKLDTVADVVFSNDAWAVPHYCHPRARHLPLAGAPGRHYRPVTPCEVRETAVFFCGVAYANRAEFVRKADDVLRRHPVEILGADWPPDIRCARNQRLTADEMADYAQRSRLTLNIGRDLDIANARYGLPQSTPGPRTFETALSGSVQLYVTTSLEVTDYFEPGVEILLVDSVRDVAEAIEWAYDDPAAATAMAARAQTRALRDHTYRNRAQAILRACAECWPAS